MPVSAQSVAERAGVSASTVSRALRDVSGVSAATRKRVREAAAELGYVASPSAARLATGRTRTVALVVPVLAKWFFAEIIAAAGQVLSREGYDVLLVELSTPQLRAQFFSAPRLQGRADGVLVAALQLSDDELGCLRSQGLEVSLVGSERAGASAVVVDDRAGGRAATRHLLNLGHQRIGFLGIRELPGSTLGGVPPAERLLGYREALAEADLAPDPTLEMRLDNVVTEGQRGMSDLLTLREPPTAVVSASDELACGALATLAGSGLAVPDDVSVVGYDDHEWSRALGLTTVDHGVCDQGRLAAQALLERLTGAAAHVERIQPHLVVRRTTAPPRPLRTRAST